MKQDRIVLIETDFDKEMLLTEILTQLTRRMSILTIRAIDKLPQRLDRIPNTTPPRAIIVGHHLPDLNAMDILPYIGEAAFLKGSRVYVVGDVTPGRGEELWRQLGADGILPWTGTPSLLKLMLKMMIGRPGID